MYVESLKGGVPQRFSPALVLMSAQSNQFHTWAYAVTVDDPVKFLLAQK